MKQNLVRFLGAVVTSGAILGVLAAIAMLAGGESQAVSVQATAPAAASVPAVRRSPESDLGATWLGFGSQI